MTVCLQGDDFSALGADSSSSNGNTAGPKVAGKKKGSSKVSRATLPRSLNWSNTTLQDALQLLALPRTVSGCYCQAYVIAMHDPPLWTDGTTAMPSVCLLLWAPHHNVAAPRLQDIVCRSHV